jgi:hypothetical protein
LIKLSKNLKLKVLKKVKVKDDDYSRPGPGHLDPGSIVQISGSPTRHSDVPFKLLSGTGEYLCRGLYEDKVYPIHGSSNRFFFMQGHETSSPYDWGTLSNDYFEVVN